MNEHIPDVGDSVRRVGRSTPYLTKNKLYTIIGKTRSYSWQGYYILNNRGGKSLTSINDKDWDFNSTEMKQHQATIGKNDEWLTPPEIIQNLGEFDLDPANAINNPFKTANESYTDGGLKKEWFGRVWLNPPFNRYQRPKWMKRMAEHNNGIMLIPAACETDAFYKYVWGCASAILFLKGRPHFYKINGEKAKANSGCTICLIAYGKENSESLCNSKLGQFIKL